MHAQNQHHVPVTSCTGGHALPLGAVERPRSGGGVVPLDLRLGGRQRGEPLGEGRPAGSGRPPSSPSDRADDKPDASTAMAAVFLLIALLVLLCSCTAGQVRQVDATARAAAPIAAAVSPDTALISGAIAKGFADAATAFKDLPDDHGLTLDDWLKIAGTVLAGAAGSVVATNKVRDGRRRMRGESFGPPHPPAT